MAKKKRSGDDLDAELAALEAELAALEGKPARKKETAPPSPPPTPAAPRAPEEKKKLRFPLGARKKPAAEEAKPPAPKPAHEGAFPLAPEPAPGPAPSPAPERLPTFDPSAWRQDGDAWVRAVPGEPRVVRRILDEEGNVVREEQATRRDVDEVTGVKAERGVGKLMGRFRK
jgi:hypothetical protein